MTSLKYLAVPISDLKCVKMKLDQNFYPKLILTHTNHNRFPFTQIIKFNFQVGFMPRNIPLY